MEATAISSTVSNSEDGSRCSDQTLQQSGELRLLTEEQVQEPTGLLENTNEGVNKLIKGAGVGEGKPTKDCTTNSTGDNSNISETNIPLFNSENLTRECQPSIMDVPEPEIHATDVDEISEKGEETLSACSTVEDGTNCRNDTLTTDSKESEDHPAKHVKEKSILLEGQDTGQKVTTSNVIADSTDPLEKAASDSLRETGITSGLACNTGANFVDADKSTGEGIDAKNIGKINQDGNESAAETLIANQRALDTNAGKEQGTGALEITSDSSQNKVKNMQEKDLSENDGEPNTIKSAVNDTNLNVTIETTVDQELDKQTKESDLISQAAVSSDKNGMLGIVCNLPESDENVESADALAQDSDSCRTKADCSATRNVFDAFPMELSGEKTRIQNESECSNTDTKTATSTLEIHTNKAGADHLDDEEANDLINDPSTNFIKTFEKFFNEGQCNEAAKASRFNDKFESEANRCLHEAEAAIVEAGMSIEDINAESSDEILKKAKEKYKLKELRVALNTEEVKDCSEQNSSAKPSKVNEPVPSLKTSEENEQVPPLKTSILSEEIPSVNTSKLNEPIPSVKTSKLNEQVPLVKTTKVNEKKPKSSKSKGNDSKTVLNLKVDTSKADIESNEPEEHSEQPSYDDLKSNDHSFDKDCAKPLKKRIRRGCEDERKDHCKNAALTDSPVCVEQKSKVSKRTTSMNSKCLQEAEHIAESKTTDTTTPGTKESDQAELINLQKKEKPVRKGKKKGRLYMKKKQQSKQHETNASKTKLNENSDAAESTPVKDDQKSTQNEIVKKYPGRLCKLRYQQSQGQSQESGKTVKVKKSTKDVKKSVDKKISVTDVGESTVKVKKKRRRKVKPWSWGNEKKRYKPKPKVVVATDENEVKISSSTINPSVDSITEKPDVSQSIAVTLQSSITNVTENIPESKQSSSVEASNNLDVLAMSKNSKCEKTDTVLQQKDSSTFIESVTNSLVHLVSKKTRKTKKKGSRRKKKPHTVSSSKSVETDRGNSEVVNAEVDDSNRQEVNADVHEAPAEHEIHVDNYPHVSPDSGIQSLAGSPAGNESPNSVILNVDPPNSNNSSETERCPVTTSSSVSVSEGIVVVTSCGFTSAGSTTCVVSTSTSTICSVSSSSLDLALSSAKKSVHSKEHSSAIDKITQKTESVLNSAFYLGIQTEEDASTSTSVATHSSHLEVPKDSSSQCISPSKKKNRAKFLHLHKTSTLLQKGRLPTEEEKEQRLEDKFDYLGKIGAGVCDNKVKTVNQTLTDEKSSPVVIKTKESNTSVGDVQTMVNDTEQEVRPEASPMVGDFIAPELSHKKKRKRKGRRKRKCFEPLSTVNCKIKKGESAVSNADVTEQLTAPELSIVQPVPLSLPSVSPVTTITESLPAVSSVVRCQSAISTDTSTTALSHSDVLLTDSISSVNADTKTECNKTVDVENINMSATQSNDKKKRSEMKSDIDHDLVPAGDSLSDINNGSHAEVHCQIKPRRGRPPKHNKSKVLHRVKESKVSKIKKKIGKPISTLKKYTEMVVKRKRGRPKGSKNKEKIVTCQGQLVSVVAPSKNKLLSAVKLKGLKPRGRPKGSPNKPKEGKLEVKNAEIKVNNPEVAPASVPCTSQTLFPAPSMMQWRESRVITGGESVEKKRRGRPPKNGGNAKLSMAKRNQGHQPKFSTFAKKLRLNKKARENDIAEQKELESLVKSVHSSIESQFSSQVSNQSDLVLDAQLEDGGSHPKIRKSRLHPLVRKGKKRGRRKGFKLKKKVEVEHSDTELEAVPEMPDLSISADYGAGAYGSDVIDQLPARSVSSLDSDTSGAGSSMGFKSLAMLLDLYKVKKKKNKKKHLYARKSKHKNIIDPVFIAQVDFIINGFTQLSISAPDEVRHWEVPLPSIFRIVMINVKKKKKDKQSVFEKAKPLKPKNELEFAATKDKIKSGRKISMVGDHCLDITDSGGQPCNLPPKKRHKLFSGLEGEEKQSEAAVKPEKRKAGRPRKVRPPSSPEVFSAGDGQKKREMFRMGEDVAEGLATFASVAALSTKASPSCPSFSSSSPFRSDSRGDRASSARAASISSQVVKQSQEKPVGDKMTNSSHSDLTTVTRERLKSAGIPSTSKDGKLPESSEQAKDVSSNSSVNGCFSQPEKIQRNHVNQSVRRLKRKYKKSRRVKNHAHLKRTTDKVAQSTEQHPSGSGENVSGEEEDEAEGSAVDTEDCAADTSVRSVCSESEPLPVFYTDSQLDNVSDTEADIPKKRQKLNWKSRRSSDASQESDTSIVKKQTMFQKKKFQKAGLYSELYKTEEKGKEREATSPYFTFDQPVHYGNHLVKNTVDFQLPYDVWWLHFNDMLPKKGDGQQYRRIRNNIYVDARPVCRYEAHSCNCKTPQNPNEKGCSEDCLNRLIYTECSPDLCSVGDQCSNQSIGRHQFAPGLQKFLTKDRGFGVKSTKPIKAGELITEYLGEVVSMQEFRRRMTEEYSQECHHYCLNLDSGTVIDGYRMGNIARFVNHSCEPNCEMQKWNVHGTYHMCLFALHNIEPGTELVYDYNFQSFNHESQQLCRCGSQSCQGIIGGRRTAKSADEKRHGKKGRHLKDKRKSKLRDRGPEKAKTKGSTPGHGHLQGVPLLGSGHMPQYMYSVKPISKKERQFARGHTIFLVRNLDKIRNMKHRSDQDSIKGDKEEHLVKGTQVSKRDVFFTQLTALKTARSVKTRRLTLAEEDTELSKIARLAGLCKEIFTAIAAEKDEEGNFLAADLYHLPTRKKHPWYYQVIDEPIDLTMIQKRILTGEYTSSDTFEKDVFKLFSNVELYCGKKSEMGDKIKQLRLVYHSAKAKVMDSHSGMFHGQDTHLDGPTGGLSDVESSENMQAPTPTTSISSESDFSEASDNKPEWLAADDDNEEIIRCICGIFKDEGVMIQCEKCYIWQHTDCMKVKGDVDNYLCEQCDPRPVDREVEITSTPEEDEDIVDDGNRYYMTLMRDDMQIRLCSCVYVMKENHSRRNSYKKSGGLNKDKMDIFRIERLWKDDKGHKFAFGHIYVRPHETFHEPSRKFFPNEVFRTPLYEVVPLESVVGYCCVMDPLTFCKGRPKGCKTEDVYVCEYRMDKTLHLFYKISPKQRYQINTKSYCFDMYEKRINPKRTYSPHEVPEAYRRNWREKSTGSVEESGSEKRPEEDEEEDVPLVKVKIERRKEKRERVNRIMEGLSTGIVSPSKKRSDLSYLLTDGK